jgi:hypothetical protein
MTAELTSLLHKIAIQLYLVAESCTICSSRCRRPVLRLLDTPSYDTFDHNNAHLHRGFFCCYVVITDLRNLQVKVRMSMCLINYHTLKTYGGVEVKIHVFLTSALDGDEFSPLRRGSFAPVERALCSH